MTRSIRTTMTRFLSILAIVTVGTGFLSGLLATTPDMQTTADKYFDDNRLYDIDIKGTLGMTDADADAFRDMDSVETVMPAQSLDLELMSGGESYITRLYGMPLDEYKEESFLNSFELVSGRLPENDGECLISSPNGYYLDQSTGGVYTLSQGNDDIDAINDIVGFKSLTAVGVVSTPQYMSVESEPSTVGAGRIELIMYVLPSCFITDHYTDIFLTLKGASALDAFTDGYTELVDKATDELKELGVTRSELRYAEIVDEAQAKLDDARAEYADAEAEATESLQDARAELDDGWKKLLDAKAELEDAKNEVAVGEKKLSSSRTKLKNETAKAREDAKIEIEARINAVRADLSGQIETQRAAGQAQIDAQRTQLDAAHTAGLISDADYAAGIAAADAAQTQLDAQTAAANEQAGAATWSAYEKAMAEATAEIDAAEAEGKRKISTAKRKLADAKEDIAEGETEIADSQRELADGETEYADKKADAERELSDALKEIEDNQKKLDDIEKPEWYILDRTDLVSFASYKSNSNKIGAIAKVFPVFFFFVAALVALTTMTRMVEEERTQVGMLKAIGYSNLRISMYYIGYAVAASLIGSAVGVALGFKTLPLVIANAYGMMYHVPRVITAFMWDYAVLIAAIAVACTTGATLIACVSQLREKPASLMLPRAPKAGKRVLLERVHFIWKRLSFTHKVTIRNIFRYKKRLYMTVFGIAGCCALLMTAFGLRDSIHDIVDKQFGEVYTYDLTIYTSEAGIEETDEYLHGILTDESDITGYTAVHYESMDAEGGAGERPVTVYAPKVQSEFTDYIVLRDRRSKEAVDFGSDSVILTEKLCEEIGVSVGDTVTLRRSEGGSADVTVTGIAENYIFGNVYMSAEKYESAFGEKPDFSMLMLHSPASAPEERDALSEKLLKSDEIKQLRFVQSIRESFENTVRSIDYIVYVLMISAGVLAVIVLYTLTNINICERRKELATLKVLGFYDREVAGYIYRETSVLCGIGILAGFAFGAWLHSFVIRTAEVDYVMFGRELFFPSFAYAAIVTVVFTVLVDVIMLGQLKKIDMIESMKAGE